MKKKIFLGVLITLAFTFVFALGICAVGSTSDEFAEAPDTIEDVLEPSKIGTNERVVLLGADGLYYTFPAYYILSDNTSFSIVVNNSVNKVLGYEEKTKLNSYVIRIEIPTGITYIGTDLNYQKNLKYVKMSDTVEDTANAAFHSCTGLETIVLSSNLKRLANDLCWGCTSLTSPITIPATVTSINGYCFYNCRIATVTNYAENVTSIGGNAFAGCPIDEFNFPDKLTSIGDSAFTGCNFATIDIPDSVTSIGKGNFSGCKNLKVLKLPESLLEIPHDFIKQTNLTLIVPKGCTKIYSQYSLGHATIQKIIFTGDADSAFLTRLAETNSGLVSKVEFGNHCEYYYDGNHNNEVTYAFDGEDKYSSTLCMYEGCARCGVGETTPYGKLFTNKGYSKETGGTYFSYGIVFNTEAIEIYTTKMGATFDYGFVAASVNDGADGNLISPDGSTLDDSYLKFDFTDTKYSIYNLKITGITEENMDTQVYCCAYIIDNSEVYYIGDCVTEKSVAISYNGVSATKEEE